MDLLPMNPSGRTLLGMALILLLILVWSVIVATVAGMIGHWPFALQMLFYLVAGIVWIVPLKPLIRWMLK
jgi:hypothetical protein